MITSMVFLALQTVAQPFAIRVDCRVPGGSATAFTYTIREQNNVSTVFVEPVGGSSIPASALTFQNTFLDITFASPNKDGTPNGEGRYWNSTSVRVAGKGDFTASAKISGGKLGPIDFTLWNADGSKIQALCTNSRYPDSEDSAKQ